MGDNLKNWFLKQIHLKGIAKIVIEVTNSPLLALQDLDSNQKFGLLEALLSVGAWKQAEDLIALLPTYHAVSQPKIAKALCKLIHITMDPLYKK